MSKVIKFLKELSEQDFWALNSLFLEQRTAQIEEYVINNRPKLEDSFRDLIELCETDDSFHEWVKQTDSFQEYKKTRKIPRTERIFTQAEAREMASMLDGAYESIELVGYRAKTDPKYPSPSNVKWSEEWLEKARKYGAKPEW